MSRFKEETVIKTEYIKVLGPWFQVDVFSSLRTDMGTSCESDLSNALNVFDNVLISS